MNISVPELIEKMRERYVAFLKSASYGVKPVIADDSAVMILSGSVIAFVKNSSDSNKCEILCKGVLDEGKAFTTTNGFKGYLKCLTVVSYLEIPNSIVAQDADLLRSIFQLMVETDTAITNFEIALQKHQSHSTRLKFVLECLAELSGYKIALEDATRIYINLQDIICLARVSRRTMSRLYLDLSKNKLLDLRKDYLWVSNGYFS